MSIFTRLKNLIMMDVANENETKKASVIMRCTSLFLSLYFLVQLIVLSFVGCPRAAVLSFFCILAYGCAFAMTYQGFTSLTQHYLEILTLGCTASLVSLIGWDCSYQHIIFVLLLFILLTSSSEIPYKIGATAFLIFFRMALYLYIHSSKPFYIVSQEQRDR